MNLNILDSLKVSRILHAGYIFECDGTQIAFDPIFENPFSHNCYAFPDVQFNLEKIKTLKLAAIFISHYHDDHCSMESLNLLDRATPIYIYCIFDEMIALIKELGFTQVYQLELNIPITIGSFEVIPRRALDADVDSIFHIKASGLNILNVVDSWIDDETLERLVQNTWDMVLWPFQTMREIEVIAPSRALSVPNELPPEWIEQLKILNPRFLVPSSCQFIHESWSWYNQAFFPITYQQFAREIKSKLPNSHVLRMNPSVSIILTKDSIQTAAPLEWVQPIGNQDVDYEYHPDLKPPTTAEISKHFAPLSESQTEKIFIYCRAGLIEKYNSMDPPEDLYFKKLRHWKLSVYDHKGYVTHFYYEINNGTIQLDFKNDKLPSWSTEVPISKFYAALELGESLTSMYLRINDFCAEDIVDDPLIRCLFNGVFGAYQIAQLKRISRHMS